MTIGILGGVVFGKKAIALGRNSIAIDPGDVIHIRLTNISTGETSGMIRVTDYAGDELIVTAHDDGLRFLTGEKPVLLTERAGRELAKRITDYFDRKKRGVRDSSLVGGL